MRGTKVLTVGFLLDMAITTQRYTQIVTGRYARCVYLVFVFTMLIQWKWNNIAENSYFSRNWQNGRAIRIQCSQKCPNPSREIQVQTFLTYFLHGLYHASAPFMYRFFARNVARFCIQSAIKPNLITTYLIKPNLLLLKVIYYYFITTYSFLLLLITTY